MTTSSEPSFAKPRLPLFKFATILNLRDSSGASLLIVGGHSVNAWAHLLLSLVPKSRSVRALYEPFTSKDLDLLGSLEDICIFK